MCFLLQRPVLYVAPDTDSRLGSWVIQLLWRNAIPCIRRESNLINYLSFTITEPFPPIRRETDQPLHVITWASFLMVWLPAR